MTGASSSWQVGLETFGRRSRAREAHREAQHDLAAFIRRNVAVDGHRGGIDGPHPPVPRGAALVVEHGAERGKHALAIVDQVAIDAVAAAFPDEPAPEPQPEPEPEPGPEAAAEETAVGENFKEDDDSLIAPPVQAAAVGSFTELARAVSSQGDSQVEIGDGRTLEQIVREALRPELKTWLDANLAPLVEQIVREEVKKLVRRAEDQ